MKRRQILRKRRIVLLATSLAAVVPAFAVVAASATSAPRHVSVAGTAAIDWNVIAVSTVRSPTIVPAKFQLEGLIYMSYVQAAVYDAVTKIEGRYKPYHKFHAPVRTDGASSEAAVAAAAYTALAYYFPAQAATLTATYTAYLAGLPAAGQAAGVAIGQAAANDIIAFRTGDGRDAVISTPYGQGPVTAGVWTFAPPPSLQSAQTPWAAFMTPFMLKTTSQFRVGPPLDITSHQYQVQFEELRAFGSLTSPVRTPEETAIGWFWNANAISQGNQTLRDLSTTHGFDLVDTARALAMGNLVDADSGMACWDSKYHLHVLAPRDGDPACRHRREQGDDGRPELDTPAHDAESPRVSGRPRLPHRRGLRGLFEPARHRPDQPRHPGRDRRRNDADHLATLRHDPGSQQRDRRRARLRGAPLPLLRRARRAAGDGRRRMVAQALLPGDRRRRLSSDGAGAARPRSVP